MQDDGRNCIIYLHIWPFDQVLDKKHKGKIICSTPRFYLSSNLCPLSDTLPQQVNKKGKMMQVCMEFVGVYCDDIFQYTVGNYAQESVFGEQGEKPVGC